MLSTTIRICSAKSRGRVRNVDVQGITVLGCSSSPLRILTTQYLKRRDKISRECPTRFHSSSQDRSSKAEFARETPRKRSSAAVASQDAVVNNCNRNETIILHNHFVVRQQLVYGRFVAFQPCRCCVENKSSITRRPEGSARMRLIHVAVVVVVAISIGRIYCVSNSK